MSQASAGRPPDAAAPAGGPPAGGVPGERAVAHGAEGAHGQPAPLAVDVLERGANQASSTRRLFMQLGLELTSLWR